jgi:hypothetical protein
MNSVYIPKKNYRKKNTKKIKYLNNEIKKFRETTNSGFI